MREPGRGWRGGVGDQTQDEFRVAKSKWREEPDAKNIWYCDMTHLMHVKRRSGREDRGSSRRRFFLADECRM